MDKRSSRNEHHESNREEYANSLILEPPARRGDAAPIFISTYRGRFVFGVLCVQVLSSSFGRRRSLDAPRKSWMGYLGQGCGMEAVLHRMGQKSCSDSQNSERFIPGIPLLRTLASSEATCLGPGSRFVTL